jgi:hypothetical protein
MSSQRVASAESPVFHFSPKFPLSVEGRGEKRGLGKDNEEDRVGPFPFPFSHSSPPLSLLVTCHTFTCSVTVLKGGTRSLGLLSQNTTGWWRTHQDLVSS